MNTFGLLGFAYSLVFRTDIKILVVEYVVKYFNIRTWKAFKVLFKYAKCLRMS